MCVTKSPLELLKPSISVGALGQSVADLVRTYESSKDFEPGLLAAAQASMFFERFSAIPLLGRAISNLDVVSSQ